MRVLLIEDEPTTAKSIELMLGTEGFQRLHHRSREEGLDLGKLYDYDIILLDLNLPDMHGYDVLKKLRTAKVGPGADPFRHRRNGQQGPRASASAPTIMSPSRFHRDELVARIHAIVRRSRAIRNRSSAPASSP
jgi:two-component system cell cycle response regulator CtrA